MDAADVWELSERVVDLVADFDDLPWWAWWRRARVRSRMQRAIEEADAIGMGEHVRALIGARA